MTYLLHVPALCAAAILTAAHVAAQSDSAVWARPELVAKVAAGELREARASWWGFDPEDSTRFLQAAIDSGAATLVVERMPSPWVATPLKAASNQRIALEEGAVILAKRGAFAGRTERLLSIDGVENVAVTGHGATLRMWRDDYVRGRDGRGRDYARGEWRHAISICGSRNVTVEGLAIKESGGDGIYVAASPSGEPSRDVAIRGCVCDRNHRQGLSVISAVNLLVENCVFRNTRGTAPEDGIDFEPNNERDRIVNCVVRNCVSENNAGNGFELALSQSRADTPPCSIRFENCRTVGDCIGIKIRTRRRAADGDYPTGTIDFAGCGVSRPRHDAVEIMQNPEGALRVSLRDCEFSGVGSRNPDAAAIALFSPFPDDPAPAAPLLENLSWPDRGNRPLFQYDTMNFAALGEEALPLLPAATDGAEVVDARPGETVATSPLKFRRHLRLVAYADRARRVAISGEHFRVGPPPGQPSGIPVAVDFAGVAKGTTRFQRVPDAQDAHPANAVARIPLDRFGPCDLSFDAPAAGFYSLELRLGGNALAVRETDAPLAADFTPWADARGWRQPQGMMDSAGSLFLPVRAGGCAEVRAAGSRPAEKVAMSVTDPSGGEVFADSSILRWTHFVAPVAETGGLWTLRFGPPASGAFEDFHAAVAGVPPFLFLTPEKFWLSP